MARGTKRFSDNNNTAYFVSGIEEQKDSIVLSLHHSTVGSSKGASVATLNLDHGLEELKKLYPQGEPKEIGAREKYRMEYEKRVGVWKKEVEKYISEKPTHRMIVPKANAQMSRGSEPFVEYGVGQDKGVVSRRSWLEERDVTDLKKLNARLEQAEGMRKKQINE